MTQAALFPGNLPSNQVLVVMILFISWDVRVIYPFWIIIFLLLRAYLWVTHFPGWEYRWVIILSHRWVFGSSCRILPLTISLSFSTIGSYLQVPLESQPNHSWSASFILNEVAFGGWELHGQFQFLCLFQWWGNGTSFFQLRKILLLFVFVLPISGGFEMLTPFWFPCWWSAPWIRG